MNEKTSLNTDAPTDLKLCKVHGNPGRKRDSTEGPAMIGSETGHISIKTSCYHQATLIYLTEMSKVHERDEKTPTIKQTCYLNKIFERSPSRVNIKQYFK